MGKLEGFERDILLKDLVLKNGELEKLAKKHNVKINTAKTYYARLKKWNLMAKGKIFFDKRHLLIIYALGDLEERKKNKKGS